MDLTSNFKSLVKTLRSRRKVLGDVDDTMSHHHHPHHLQQHPQHPQQQQGQAGRTTNTNTSSRAPKIGAEGSRPFNRTVKEMVKCISRMKSFLLTHRTDYIDPHFVMYNASRMSDVEREQIDQEAQKFIAKYRQVIVQLRKDVVVVASSEGGARGGDGGGRGGDRGGGAGGAAASQRLEHQLIVLAMVEEYLRQVGRIWAEQRSLRMKRAKKMRVFGSLTGGRKVKELPGATIDHLIEALPPPRTTAEPDDDGEAAAAADDEGFDERLPLTTAGEGDSSSTKAAALDKADDRQASFINEYGADGDDDGNNSNAHNLFEFSSVEITSEDVQLLEEENTRLYDELNSMAEQVKHIEGRVAEIFELQKRFTEKVIEQDEDVQRIAHTMLAATENVRDANEQLRQAMQNHAGLRVAVLFALIVLSCSLLFLDWYNP